MARWPADQSQKSHLEVRSVYSSKTMKGEGGEITINVPRDREGHFEPKIVGKHQTRFDGFDEKIIALYARGLSVTDIQAQLQELYHIESMNMTLRKVIKNKRVFPSDDSVFKVLYLAIQNISKRWTMPIHHWKSAMNRFMMEYAERVSA